MSADRPQFTRREFFPIFIGGLTLFAPIVPTWVLRLFNPRQPNTIRPRIPDQPRALDTEITAASKSREFGVTGTGPKDIHFPGTDNIEGTGIEAFVDLHHTENDNVRVYKVRPTLGTELQEVVGKALSYSLIKVAGDLEVVVITYYTKSQTIDYGTEILETSRYITIVKRDQDNQLKITDSLTWNALPLPENLATKGMRFIEGYPGQPTVGYTREGSVVINFTSGFIPRNGSASFVTPGITRMSINTTTGKLEPAR